jgi:hypothetical protein
MEGATGGVIAPKRKKAEPLPYFPRHFMNILLYTVRVRADRAGKEIELI